MKASFKEAQFLTSALKEEEWPVELLPEIALVGRSNVGKSSLMNHLLLHKSLAKVSSTPGKTQRINYFTIDQQFYLVDLPGYGYAKVNRKTQKEWGQYLEPYLTKRSSLRLLLLLLDIRRAPSEEDLALLNWIKFQNIPAVLVLTKSDKLSLPERKKQAEIILQEKTLSGLPYVYYSIKNGKCRRELIEIINRVAWD